MKSERDDLRARFGTGNFHHSFAASTVEYAGYGGHSIRDGMARIGRPSTDRAADSSLKARHLNRWSIRAGRTQEKTTSAATENSFQDGGHAAGFPLNSLWAIRPGRNMPQPKTARRFVTTLVVSGIAVLAWAAFSSGYDVGRSCFSSNPSPSYGWFHGCCTGGCLSMHQNGSPGHSACMSKCMSCIESGCKLVEAEVNP